MKICQRPLLSLQCIVICLSLCVSSTLSAPTSQPTTSPIEFVGKFDGDVQAVAVSGTFAYVGAGRAFQVVDVASPQQPVLTGTLSLPSDLHTISVNSEGMAYVIAGTALYIVDVDDPVQPLLRGNYPFTSTIQLLDLDVAGSLAYISTTRGLDVIDVSNPDMPTLCCYLRKLPDVRAASVVDNLLYASWADWLYIFDVSNPGVFTTLGGYRIQGAVACGLEIDNTNKLASYGFYDGIKLIDVRAPNAMQLWSTFLAASHRTCHSQIVDGLLYLTDAANGLLVLDIRNPKQPRLVANYNTPGTAGQLRVIDNLIYVADSAGGLQILRIHPELIFSKVFLPVLTR